MPETIVEIDGTTDLSRYVGERSTFTTWEGERREGVIESFDGLHPIIRFADGKWARGTSHWNVERGTHSLSLVREPTVAYDRAETEPCERGTEGCSIRHPNGPETDCQPW